MASPAGDNTSERRFPMFPRKYAGSIPGRTAGEFAPGQEWNGALIIKSEVGSIYIQESISSALFCRINTNFSNYRIYTQFLRNETSFSFWIFRMTLLNLKVFKTLNMWQITSIYLFIHISCSYHMDWACRSTGLNPCRVLINSFKLYHFWQNPHFPFKLHVVGFGLIPDREAAKFMKHQKIHSQR